MTIAQDPNTPPQVLTANYDGAQVIATWAPPGRRDVEYYTLEIKSLNGGQTFSGRFKPDEFQGSVPIPGGFQPPYQYQCTIVAMIVDGPADPSSPVPLITVTPGVDSIRYDGAVIAFEWQPMVGNVPPVISYTVEAIPQGEDILSKEVQGAWSSRAVIHLDESLPPASSWKVAVSANAALGVSSTTTYPLITYLPSWDHALYRSTVLTVDWGVTPPPPAGTIQGFTVDVVPREVGPSYSSKYADPSASHGEVPFPSPLLEWRKYGVRISAYASGGIVRAESPRLAMVVDRPRIISAAGSTTQVKVAWRPLPHSAHFSQYIVVARPSTSGGQNYRLPISDPAQTTATLDFSPPLPGSPPYLVEIHATGATDEYEESGEPVPVLITAPTGLSTTFDGSVLLCSWTAVAGAAGYTVTVTDADATLATAEVSATEAAIAIPLWQNRAYAVNVSAGTGGLIGPPVTNTVLAAVPVVTSVAYDDTNGTTLTWTPLAAATGATGYQVQLYLGDKPSGAPIAVSGVGTGTTRLPGKLDPFCRFGVTVRATAPAALGPESAVAAVLTATPEFTSADYDGQSLSLAWTALADERVTGYETLVNGVSNKTVAPSLVLPGALATAPQITVRALGDQTTGPASANLVPIIAGPQITAAAYDGLVTVAWNATGDNTYVVSILDGPATIAALETSATTAAIPVQLDPSRSWTAAVRSQAGVVLGPASTVQLIAAPVSGCSTTFDAATAQCTVKWAQVASATGYGVRITEGAAIIVDTTVTGSGTTSYPVTAQLHPERTYSARIRTITGMVTGPWGDAAPILAGAPQGLAVAWDGAVADLIWDEMAGAKGYRAAILRDGTESASLTTTELGAQIPVADDPAHVFTAVVAAITDAAIGAPSEQVPLFAPAYFLSTATNAAPYLTPANAASRSPYDIVLYLPNLFPVPPDKLPDKPPFVLAATTVQPFSYTLTIAADSAAWTFDSSSIRAGLQKSYLDFIEDLDKNLKATPQGLATVLDAIARAMPQTFAETLFYGYGFDAGNGFADLRPGTGLRVEYESYQYTAAPSDPTYKNGFVAGNVADYNLGTFLRGGSWLVGLDAFIARMAAASGVSIPTPAQASGKMQGGGGVADASYPQFQQPFLRLVYPPGFLPQDSQGSPNPVLNAVLVAAGSYGALQTTTANIRKGSAPGSAASLLYFRGRAVPRPTIQVTVDGQVRTVVLGTTVGDIVASAATRPPILNLSYRHITVLRARGSAITDADWDAAAGYAIGGARWPIQIDWHPANAYNAVSDRFDLPLMHGDRILTGL